MGALPLITWDAPGPYRVAFSTRQGGVSEGVYESLNLGILTADRPARVVENRTRLCAETKADPQRATLAWQQHGARVTKAEARGIVSPGTVYEACDGLWSDEPGQPMVLLAADCLPIVLARLNGRAPALAVLHVGWRGLLAGIVAAGAEALGAGELAAVVGPGIGPCCYEVGQDVEAPFRAAYGAAVVREGRLDLWSAAEQALRDAGCRRVGRTDLCTACHPELFFSHRRDGGRTGRQGVVAYVT